MTLVSTRLEPPVAEWLSDRATRMHTGSAHLQAKTELTLWRGILAAELRRIRLTLDEARCLADVLNTSMLDATFGTPGLVFAECYDAFRIARDTPTPDLSSYGAKWGINEEPLLERLGALGPSADHALRDALSRWWEQGQDATVNGFTAVGMRVYDPGTD